MRGRLRFRHLNAHALHEVITGVHSTIGVDNTVQAVTDAVVNFGGFGVAAVSVSRAGGWMEMVAVTGSDDARQQLQGSRKPRRAYDEEFDVAQRWGHLAVRAARTVAGR